MTKQIDPQAALEQMWKLAPQYAQAKANRVYAEEYRQTIKARLMRESDSQSVGAQERDAYAHDDYVAHLEAIKQAVAEEETLRWRLISAQAAVEVWRSTEASNRNIDRAAK